MISTNPATLYTGKQQSLKKHSKAFSYHPPYAPPAQVRSPAAPRPMTWGRRSTDGNAADPPQRSARSLPQEHFLHEPLLQRQISESRAGAAGSGGGASSGSFSGARPGE